MVLQLYIAQAVSMGNLPYNSKTGKSQFKKWCMTIVRKLRFAGATKKELGPTYHDKLLARKKQREAKKK